MKAYKHMRAEHAAPAMKEGALKIARVSEFRRIESGPLADPIDGAVEHVVDRIILDNDADPTQRRVRAAMAPSLTITYSGPPVTAQPGLGPQISNVRFVRTVPDDWALCLSTVKTGKASSVYDALIEAPNLKQLAQAIADAHPSMLGRWRIGVVQYARRIFDVREGPQAADAFVKGQQFQEEREVRILWQARSPEGSTYITRGLGIAAQLNRIF